MRRFAIVGERACDRFSLLGSFLSIPEVNGFSPPECLHSTFYRLQATSRPLMGSGSMGGGMSSIHVAVSCFSGTPGTMRSPPVGPIQGRSQSAWPQSQRNLLGAAIHGQVTNQEGLASLISQAVTQAKGSANADNISVEVTAQGEDLPDLIIVDVPVQDPASARTLLQHTGTGVLVATASPQGVWESNALRLVREADPALRCTVLVLLCREQEQLLSCFSAEQVRHVCEHAPAGLRFALVAPAALRTSGPHTEHAPGAPGPDFSRLTQAFQLLEVPCSIGIPALLQALSLAPAEGATAADGRHSPTKQRSLTGTPGPRTVEGWVHIDRHTTSQGTVANTEQDKGAVSPAHGLGVSAGQASNVSTTGSLGISAASQVGMTTGSHGDARGRSLNVLADAASLAQGHDAISGSTGHAGQQGQVRVPFPFPGGASSTGLSHFSEGTAGSRVAQRQGQSAAAGPGAITLLDDEALVRALLSGPHGGGPHQFPLEDSFLRIPEEPLPGPQYALQRSTRSVQESRVDVQRTFSKGGASGGGASGSGTFTWMDRQRTYFHAFLSARVPRWQVRRQGDRDATRSTKSGVADVGPNIQCTVKKKVLRYREGDSFGQYRLEEYSLESVEPKTADSALEQLVRDSGVDWDWLQNQLTWHEKEGFWVRRVLVHMTPWPFESETSALSRKVLKRRSLEEVLAPPATLERRLNPNLDRRDTAKQGTGSPLGLGGTLTALTSTVSFGAQAFSPGTERAPGDAVRPLELSAGVSSLTLKGLKVSDPSATHDIRSKAGSGWGPGEMALHSAFQPRLSAAVRALQVLKDAGEQAPGLHCDRSLSVLLLGSANSAKHLPMDSLAGIPVPVPQGLRGEPRGVPIVASFKHSPATSVSWQKAAKVPRVEELQSLHGLPAAVASVAEEKDEPADTFPSMLSLTLTVQGPGLPTINLVNLPDVSELDTSATAITRNIEKHYAPGRGVFLLVMSALELLHRGSGQQPGDPWAALGHFSTHWGSAPAALVLTEVDSVEWGQDLATALHELITSEAGGFHVDCFAVCDRRSQGLRMEEGRAKEVEFLVGHPLEKVIRMCNGSGLGMTALANWICLKLAEGQGDLGAALESARQRKEQELSQIPPPVTSPEEAEMRCAGLVCKWSRTIQPPWLYSVGRDWEGVKGLMDTMGKLRRTLEEQCARVASQDTCRILEKGGLIPVWYNGHLVGEYCYFIDGLSGFLSHSVKTCFAHKRTLLRETLEAVCGKSKRLALFLQSCGQPLLEKAEAELVREVKEWLKMEKQCEWAALGTDSFSLMCAREVLLWLLGSDHKSNGVLESMDLGHLQPYRTSASGASISLQSGAGKALELLFCKCWVAQQRIADVVRLWLHRARRKVLEEDFVASAVSALREQDHVSLINCPDEREAVNRLQEVLKALTDACTEYRIVFEDAARTC